MKALKYPLPPPIDNRMVFVNNELDLSEIDVYGFDYDYTLAIYRKSLNSAIYEMALKRMVSGFKMDAFCNIQKGTAHRGKKILSEDDVNNIYNGHHIPQHYLKCNSLENKRMGQLLDLFSLPEIGLLSNVVEYFENNSIPYNSLSILHDVRSATGQIHSTGEMHQAILKNTDKFIKRLPGLRQFFERLMSHKKYVFLISNSPYYFIDSGMRYLLGDDWQKLFNCIIVQAKKPNFFRNTFRQFRVYWPDTGKLAWEKVTKIDRGIIYAGGNLEDFLQLSGIGNKGVLYFGDHVSYDLAEPTRRVGWRIAAIVPELTKEIRIQNSEEYRRKLLWLQVLTSLIDEQCSEEAEKSVQMREILRNWCAERQRARDELEIFLNPHFGSIFRCYHNPSYFLMRLLRVTDVYMAKVTSLLQYDIEHTFFASRWPLPHEADLGVVRQCRQMAAPTGTSSNRQPPTSVYAVYAAGPCALVVARAADVGLGCGYDHLLVEYHHNSRMGQRCLQSVGSGRRSLVISSLLVTLISNLFSRRCQAIQLPDIYWNSSNPIFQVGTQQPVLKVRIGDRLNIVCPYYPSPTVHADKFEYMEIYGTEFEFVTAQFVMEINQLQPLVDKLDLPSSVTRKSYEECILNDRATIVGVCNTPTVPTVLTMVIREFTPNPSGLEFKPGRKYYFISTSTGSRAGLANRNGGLCSKNKMKMMFDVRRSDARTKIKTDEYFFITYHTPGMVGEDYQEDAEEHLLMNEKEEEDIKEPIVEENVDLAIEPETTTPLLYIIHTRPYDEISASWYNKDKFANSHLQYIDSSSNNKASLTVQMLLLAILLLFHYR
ncbi:5'-nucleotidase domain-containing protein 3 [Trichinella murrelli]|uniref:5'-nucleotidase domain-containing protein 3 n=1 Tax=Trichinella murrelli TaxID=144512 RepID=A0A0V0TJ86_9BILA|nr:5'-nucleotidase domain-containing protein 3 [Trichinella murrelli]